MEYRPNIVPTMNELASGALEPTSKAFKGYVGMFRFAPIYAVTLIIAGFVANAIGFWVKSPDEIVSQGVITSLSVAFFSLFQISRTRKPTISQIRRLAHLVRLDPSLAMKVNSMGEKDYTFKKLQRFILENSARANEREMNLALDELDEVIRGSR